MTITRTLMEIAAIKREKMKAPEPTGDNAKSLEIPEVRSSATTVAADAAAIMTPYRVIDTKTVAPIFALIAHSFENSCPAPNIMYMKIGRISAKANIAGLRTSFRNDFQVRSPNPCQELSARRLIQGFVAA